jgi:hypothetical protein
MVSKNAALVAAGKTNFVLCGESVATSRQRTARTVLPYLAFAASEPRFADALPRAAFERHVDAAVRGAVERGRVNVRTLRRLFRLTDAEIANFACAAARATCDAGHAGRSRRIDASAALATFRAALLAKYDDASAREERTPLEWWLVVDPSSQFTASRTPRPSTPLAWYGDLLAEHDEPPSKDETIEALLARLTRDAANAPGALGDGTCPLCYEPLGERNVVTLVCGHSFHMSEAASGCRGLCAWATQTCPMCREPFSGVDRADRAGRSGRNARGARAPIPLHVEW